MTTTKKMKRTPVREMTVEEGKAELRSSITAYEEKYGYKSEAMLEMARTGAFLESMEIARWCFDCRALARLEAPRGHTPGTRTKTT